MTVERLALTDFRSYSDAVVDVGPGLIVLTGENGSGKTNILEALSLLSPGRGLRGASLADMARDDGPGGFAVAARLAGGTEIGTGTLASAPERRQIRINGTAASAGVMAEWLSLLWLTPAMDRLFLEGAGGRRRFLDRLVLAIDPEHARHATRYEAAMRSRNKLLADPVPDAQWLDALETAMADHGEAISRARSDAVAGLNSVLALQPAGPFPAADLAIEPPQEADLMERLRAGRMRDAAAGRTLAGPHRADLRVTHRQKDQPAERCSTGEQKALLLGIILAHADLVARQRGHRPVLLLDEVAAHLDSGRRAALFERLAAAGGQVWMTGTEPDLFAAAPQKETQRFTISGGALRPIA